VKQGKQAAAAGTGSLFPDQLQKMHADLLAVGEKAVDCVVPAKIQAKAANFIHGLRDAPDAPWMLWAMRLTCFFLRRP